MFSGASASPSPARASRRPPTSKISRSLPRDRGVERSLAGAGGPRSPPPEAAEYARDVRADSSSGDPSTEARQFPRPRRGRGAGVPARDGPFRPRPGGRFAARPGALVGGSAERSRSARHRQPLVACATSDSDWSRPRTISAPRARRHRTPICSSGSPALRGRGFSMKSMHRLIVTSRDLPPALVRARPDLAEIDPRNLLLARQSRVRLDAEVIRDAALRASGLLSPTIGGAPVQPPQPDGVYAFTQNDKDWMPTSIGPERYRRAMYTFFYRSAPYPLFGTFEAPDFQTTCTRRTRSNTPLQALTIANDTAFMMLELNARVIEASRLVQEARIRRASASTEPAPDSGSSANGRRAADHEALPRSPAPCSNAWTRDPLPGPPWRRVRSISTNSPTGTEAPDAAHCQTRRHFSARAASAWGPDRALPPARQQCQIARADGDGSVCQAGDLPVHGRRAEPARALRAQAEAATSSTARPRRRAPPTASASHSSKGDARCSVRRRVRSPDTGSAAHWT